MFKFLADTDLQTAIIALVFLMLWVASAVLLNKKPSRTITLIAIAIVLAMSFLVVYTSQPLASEYRSQLMNDDDECIVQAAKKEGARFSQLALLSARIRCKRAQGK